MRKYVKRKVAKNLRHPKGIFGWFIGSLMNHFNKGIIQFTVDAIPKKNVFCIVEAGIGSGKALELCAKRFPEVILYGVDISKSMLLKAKIRNRKSIRKGNMIVYHSDISKLPLVDQSVDVLYTINTLYFWNDPDLVFKEIRRVLKNEGQFILSFNPKEEMNKDLYPKDLFTLYSTEEVSYLARNNTFDVISSHKIRDRFENYVCMILQKTDR
jgi:ubiquinone/menaquinone biosynthesis C-methylase UbiE